MRQPVENRRTPNFLLPVLALLLSLFLSYTDLPAEEFHNALSMQGFTGLLNTPNAATTKEGHVYGLFSNQKESQWRDQLSRQENYMVSVGLFDFMEIGGRLTEAPGVARDLSANVKLSVPYLPKEKYVPSVAFGIQDFGGGAKKLQTSYAVASEEIWRARFSLGYGAGPERMKGIFGGVEVKAHDWVYLIAENDTKETNVGLRLITPELFGYPVNLHFTAKTSLNNDPGNISVAFGLQVPLGSDHHNTRPLPKRLTNKESSAALEFAVSHDYVSSALAKIKEALTNAGFQNVEIGEKDGKLLVVEYENNRYNHNELDGLGVVIGLVTQAVPENFELLRFVIKKEKIRILEISAPLKDLRAFLEDASTLPHLEKSLQITRDVSDEPGVVYVGGNNNSSLFRSTLLLYPSLKTYVATEVGVFDYLLSLKADLYFNTWPGGVVNARWDIPVVWSENFDDQQPFRSDRRSSQLDRLMFFQGVKFWPSVMGLFGAGKILYDNYGTLNEIAWAPGKGEHRFKFRQAYAEDRAIDKRREVYLGSYRYYFSSANIFIEGTGGKFWGQDTGFAVELKRFFGDTAISFYYKNSETEDRKQYQVVGAQINLPLTPRRDMKPGLLQVRGSDDWSYSQESLIASPENRNVVGTSVGIVPEPLQNIDRVFYNRDRLNEQYIRQHLLRLRDAHIKYNTGS